MTVFMQEQLEYFALSTVQHIQPVIDACSYNNICAVALKEPDQKMPDIHLYQCIDAPVSEEERGGLGFALLGFC